MSWAKNASSSSALLLSKQVQHTQVTRVTDSGDTITENIFENPDANSPIAGILVYRYASVDGTHMLASMQLLVREGKTAEAKKLLNANGLGTEKTMSLHHPEIVAGLAELGLAVQRDGIVLLGDARNLVDAGNRTAFVARSKDVLDLLATSDILSTQPALRQTLLDALSKQWTTLRGTADSNRVVT